MGTGIAVLSGLVIVYALLARKLASYSITMPIIFMLFGVLAGERMQGLAQLAGSVSATKIAIEITLALFLFVDASTLAFRQVREDARLPGRLLLIGLPLTLLVGSLAAYVMFPAAGSGFALLLGAILAPTDLSLGIPIFTNPRVPGRVRRILTLESGLNDGLAAPLVTLFTALVLFQEGVTAASWLSESLIEIAIAAAVGILFGLVGGWLFRLSNQYKLSTSAAAGIGNLALALCVFIVAQLLGGNGLIAAFLGGIAFGYATRDMQEKPVEFTETCATVGSLLVWVLFGAMIVLPILQDFALRPFLYALLSLTLVRMLPVAAALFKTPLRSDTRLLIGWLGPRGLASVVFLLIIVESSPPEVFPLELLIETAGWTIALSVLLHGLTAVPLANWYDRRLRSAPADTAELQEVLESSRLPGRRKGFFHLPHIGQ